MNLKRNFRRVGTALSLASLVTQPTLAVTQSEVDKAIEKLQKKGVVERIQYKDISGTNYSMSWDNITLNGIHYDRVGVIYGSNQGTNPHIAVQTMRIGDDGFYISSMHDGNFRDVRGAKLDGTPDAVWNDILTPAEVIEMIESLGRGKLERYAENFTTPTKQDKKVYDEAIRRVLRE